MNNVVAMPSSGFGVLSSKVHSHCVGCISIGNLACLNYRLASRVYGDYYSGWF